MSEMLEKAARALLAEAQRQADENWGYVDLLGTEMVILDGDFDLTAMVRVVLQAIREPSDEVAQAGNDANDCSCGFPAAPSFTAMIDEVLK